uniref:Uncharacterized protein LOC111107287 isoform X1 n=1 Tax=Crassostrea virginica TaxID=6565 RepID=A0A8B8B3Y2_CRAVI|nr:uncharacterized protein LOC111107287 isoform X1 [Crassostrea virginica]
MRFEKGLPFILNICLFMNFVDANPKIFPFGKTCSLEPHQMNEDSTFYLSYFNISRPGELWCSYIAFSGQGSNSKDKFQICTTLNIFTDPGCNLKLTLRNSLNGTVLKTFSCMEYSKSKFCAKQGRDLYFVAEFQETDEKLRSDFLFHIEATKTYDHLKTLAGITGGAIGLVLLITIAIVIKCCKMRNNSPLVKSKFNIIDRFFCRNAGYEQEFNRSSPMVESRSREHACAVLHSASRRPHSDDLSVDTSSIYVDPSVFFSVYNLRSPPPYQTEDNQAFDPPPEYS